MSYYFYKISHEFFYALTGAMVVLTFLELAWPGLVLAHINISWILLLWLFIGIVLISTKARISPHEK